jgi:hypothetical protein
VKALAAGLEQPSMAVRERAARLLGPPQHASECLAVLVDALRDVDARVRRLMPDVREFASKELGRDGNVRLDDLKRLQRDTQKALDAVRGIRELSSLRHVLVGQLAGLPDDRVVAAILAGEPSLPSEAGVKALLGLASRPAVEGVLGMLASWQDERPSSAEARADHEARGRVLLDGLAALARERGLEPIPAATEAPHGAWRAWWDVRREAFAASLPGVRTASW